MQSIAGRVVLPLCLMVLAVVAVLNPSITQAGYYFFPSGIAGMSLMQLFQGVFFLVVLATLPFLLPLWHGYASLFARLLLAFTFVLGLVYFRGEITGKIPSQQVRAEQIYYFKVIFALTVWLYVSLVIRNSDDARQLLYCIVIGSSLCAVVILYFYITGRGQVRSYLYAGVIATRGAEGVSGKATLGYLLTSIWATLYLLINFKKPWLLLPALLLLAASFVMYDRSSQVAFVLSGAWLVGWGIFVTKNRHKRNRLMLFIVFLVVVATVYFSRVGFDQLMRRWTYDFSRGEIGSGRSTFWISSLDWLKSEADWADFLFGMGYGQMVQRMASAAGIWVHTHSDLFDLLLIAGVLGLFLLALLYYTLMKIALIRDKTSSEFSVMVAVFISYAAMSCLTGQFGAPHAMFTIMSVLWCLRLQCESLDRGSLL
ncbi:MAG TPA: hypothetical protein ENN81_10115 [Phycisphaerales bacterium]|nr:hypothetical protein [Phycisphaerales bacterium]